MTPAQCAYAGALLAAFGAGWMVNGWRHEASAAELQAAAEHERAEAFRWVQSEQKRSAAAMALADTEALGRVRDVEQESDGLRACIAAGRGCGLRVQVARTPAKCGGMPEAGAPAGVGDRGVEEWAELSPAAGLRALDARDLSAEVVEALALCVSQWPGEK